MPRSAAASLGNWVGSMGRCGRPLWLMLDSRLRYANGNDTVNASERTCEYGPVGVLAYGPGQKRACVYGLVEVTAPETEPFFLSAVE